MPFAVTKWGYEPDPRPPDFGLIGFDFGALPPWQWFMKTTDARAPYEVFNTGVIWASSAPIGFGPAFVSYVPVTPIPGIDAPVLRLAGLQPPVGGISMNFDCTFFPPIHMNHAFGTIQEFYLNAIGVRTFFMNGGGTGDPFFPEPLTITPRKWNFVF